MKRSLLLRLLSFLPALIFILALLILLIPHMVGSTPWGAVKTVWAKYFWFRLLIWSMLITLGIHLCSAAFVDSRIEHRHEEYRSDKIPEALDGYTVVFLSDIHYIPEPKLQAAIDKINATGVDLALLGGDYTQKDQLDWCMGMLSQIQAADGVYGVAGNHDRIFRLKPVMESYGINLLQNSGVQVQDGLWLAGLEDLWFGKPDVKAALNGAGPDDLVLLLSHNPDASMDLDMDGVDLMLSGHVHGGEITLYGLWAPAAAWETRYGSRFLSGWCKGSEGADVYVGRGIGKTTRLLPRVFARPQVIYVTFRRA